MIGPERCSMLDRLQQGRGEISARIDITIGEKLEMANFPGTGVVVQRPLERNSLVGPSPHIARNRRRKGLEIEIARRRPKFGEGFG